jgi:pimeloyl-ACP methyl ester carboxylesterase
MPTFLRENIEIAFIDHGAGEPIVLLHGFGSDKERAWVDRNWFTTLTGAGRRVIAADTRGHGQSSKLYDPAAYQRAILVEDVRALLDHLGLRRADVMGYSMGARITASLALTYPERVRSAIVGGLGSDGRGEALYEAGLADRIADALEAPSSDAVVGPLPLLFRLRAEQYKSDLKALAACMRGRSRENLTPEEIASFRVPILVAVGTEDRLAGSPHALASKILGGRALDIPGCDHETAPGHPVFKAGVLDFLAQQH